MSMAISLKQERSLVSHDEYGAMKNRTTPRFTLSVSLRCKNCKPGSAACVTRSGL